MISKQIQVHLALFMVALLYGATFTIAKEIMPQHLIGESFVTLRITISAILFLIVNLFMNKQGIKGKNDWLRLIACAFTGCFLNMILFFKGLEYTFRINGAVLMMFTPIFAVIISWVFLKEPMKWYIWLGLLLASIGGYFFIGGNGVQFTSQTIRGDIYIIINAILYAVYLALAKPLIIKYNPITVSTYCFAIGSIFMIPIGYQSLTNTNFSIFPNQIWLGIGFVIVGTTFITYLLNAWALKYASPSLVGAYIYLQPILAALIAILAGKEQAEPIKIIFALLIFVGVFLVSKAKQQTKL